MKDEKKKEIAEIVKNMQNMTRESILIMKNAAEVLRIRDSMDKKAGQEVNDGIRMHLTNNYRDLYGCEWDQKNGKK